MRKQSITFKIRNHLLAIFPNLTFHTNREKAVEIPSGEYWYSRIVRKTQRKKRAIIVTLLAICVGINMLCIITI